MDESKETQEISRRGFLGSTGAAVVGAAGLVVAGETGCASTAEKRKGFPHVAYTLGAIECHLTCYSSGGQLYTPTTTSVSVDCETTSASTNQPNPNNDYAIEGLPQSSYQDFTAYATGHHYTPVRDVWIPANPSYAYITIRMPHFSGV